MKKAGRPPMDKKVLEEKINNAFKDVCKLVEDGLTIRQALKRIDIGSDWFYKYLSERQKLELQHIKTANTIYGVGSIYKK